MRYVIGLGLFGAAAILEGFYAAKRRLQAFARTANNSTDVLRSPVDWTRELPSDREWDAIQAFANQR